MASLADSKTEVVERSRKRVIGTWRLVIYDTELVGMFAAVLIRILEPGPSL